MSNLSPSARPGDAIFLKACSTVEAAEWDTDCAALRALKPEDWGRTQLCALRNGVTGLVARNLAWARERCGVEPPILEDLSRRRARRLTVQLLRRKAAAQAVRALQDAGVDLIVFKGFVLAEEVYGDLSARGFGDCDILVRPEAVQSASDVLANLGFHAPENDFLAATTDVNAHGLCLERGDGVKIDLHWSLGHHFSAAQTDLVWREAPETAESGGLGRRRLSPELTLIQLAAHFCHHDLLELKPLVDFYLVAARMEDRIRPDRLGELTRELGLAPVVDFTARLCGRRFRPRPAIDRLFAGPPSTRARIALATVASDDLAAPEQPVGRWSVSARRRLLFDGVWAVLRWSAPWMLPPPRHLAERFKRRFRWWFYPRYYGLQAYRVLTGSRKLFKDFIR